MNLSPHQVGKPATNCIITLNNPTILGGTTRNSSSDGVVDDDRCPMRVVVLVLRELSEGHPLLAEVAIFAYMSVLSFF